jgi:hypothetical protein
MFKKWFKRITQDKSLPVVNRQDIKVIFHTQIGDRLSKSPMIILSDENYVTITTERIQRIYNRSGLIEFKYRDEVSDCDDAALLFKSELIKDANNDWSTRSGYAAGIVYGHIPTPHAVNWFITPDKVLMFIEPSTGEIFKPKGKDIFFLFA